MYGGHLHSTAFLHTHVHTQSHTSWLKDLRNKMKCLGQNKEGCCFGFFFIFCVSIINMHEFYGRLRCDQLFINSMLIASTVVNF